jgi:hypothetical protein
MRIGFKTLLSHQFYGIVISLQNFNIFTYSVPLDKEFRYLVLADPYQRLLNPELWIRTGSGSRRPNIYVSGSYLDMFVAISKSKLSNTGRY